MFFHKKKKLMYIDILLIKDAFNCLQMTEKAI